MEIGYEIKDGKLGRMLKNCTYTGMTPQFWRSCDAVCSSDHWEIWGPQLWEGSACSNRAYRPWSSPGAIPERPDRGDGAWFIEPRRLRLLPGSPAVQISLRPNAAPRMDV